MTQMLTFRDPKTQPFPTFAEMQSTHNALLRRQREHDVILPAGEVSHFILRACATGAYIDAEAQRESTQALIDYWTATLFRAKVEPPAGAALEDFNPMLAPELPDSKCPYVGLEAFKETNTDYFFGRQRLIDSLLASLRELRFLAVLGQSGSGKSSLIMGGMLPKLRNGAIYGSERWNYLPVIVPGSDPLRALAKLFANEDADALADAFRRDVGHLKERLDTAGAPAVLLIDQFEELFTLCDNTAAREAFASNVAALVASSSYRHSVIITMRSDFDLQIARVPQLQTLVEDGRVYITPLNASELRDAIEKPAALAGLKFEEGVVDGLVADTLGEPAALPLLQFSLLKLWDARQKNRVTLAAYKKLGGGRLALEKTAESLFQSLIFEDQIIAKRILLRVVRVEFGTEAMRNRIRKADLIRATDNAPAIEHVLEKLIAARLVRFTAAESEADDQIEVAHESLVRNWPALAKWVEEDRADLKTLRHYEALAADWIRFERKSGLLDAVQLREAKEWLNGTAAAELGYSPAVAEFLDASEQRIEEAAAEVRAQKRRWARWMAAVITLVIASLAFFVLFLWADRNKTAKVLELERSEREYQTQQTNFTNLLREREQRQNAREAEIQRAAKEALEKALAKLHQTNAELVKKEQELESKQKEINQQNDSLKAALTRASTILQDYITVKTAERAPLQPGKPLPSAARLGLSQKRRPLVAGSSISELDALPQSNVCCVVRDRAGKRYLLALQLVFSDKGKKIVQPASSDGGREQDVIAIVTKVGQTDHSGTIAELIPQDLKMDPEIPEIGQMSRIAFDLRPGTKLRGIGRGSGVIRGTISKTDEEGDYVMEVSSQIEDIGAPAFTDDGRLAGLIVGGFGKLSWVIPIVTVLKGLDVDLEPPAPIAPNERIAETRVHPEPARDMKLDERHRPLKIGSSISEIGGKTSSVCCVVRDDGGTRYLLLMQMVFSDADEKIIQPAEDDGGTEADTIAVVTKVGPNDRSGTLAKLEPNDLKIDPEIPEIGKISDLAVDLRRGASLKAIGRGSGLVSGRLLEIDEDGDYVTTLQVTTSKDQGAPVFTDDGRLAGLMIGGMLGKSWVVPIADVLKNLNVRLETVAPAAASSSK